MTLSASGLGHIRRKAIRPKTIRKIGSACPMLYNIPKVYHAQKSKEEKMSHYPPAGPGGPTHLVERGGRTCGYLRRGTGRGMFLAIAQFSKAPIRGLPGNRHASPIAGVVL